MTPETAPAQPDIVTPFLQHQPTLFALAYRLLGSVQDAEDAVQDTYVRWAAVEPDSIANPAAFLTTVTTRLALDRLRSAAARREVYTGPWLPEPLPTATAEGADPAETVALRESASIGMLLLLERLNPIERAVFVLREAFTLPYDEIAEIVDRSPAHCRQLHRRAGMHATDVRRVQTGTDMHAGLRKGHTLAENFLSAARGGDMEALKALLREDVVLTTDGGGQVSSARRPIHGATKVSRLFTSLFTRWHVGAPVARTEYNHAPALLIERPDRVLVYVFDIDADRIANVYGIFNPDKLRHLTARHRAGRPQQPGHRASPRHETNSPSTERDSSEV